MTKMLCMADWTGTPPLRRLDELAAFDAMRWFLEQRWKEGMAAEYGLVDVLSELNRTVNALPGAPLDPAHWDDWRAAVTLVLQRGSSPTHDPLEG